MAPTNGSMSRGLGATAGIHPVASLNLCTAPSGVVSSQSLHAFHQGMLTETSLSFFMLPRIVGKFTSLRVATMYNLSRDGDTFGISTKLLHSIVSRTSSRGCRLFSSSDNVDRSEPVKLEQSEKSRSRRRWSFWILPLANILYFCCLQSVYFQQNQNNSIYSTVFGMAQVRKDSRKILYPGS